MKRITSTEQGYLRRLDATLYMVLSDLRHTVRLLLLYVRKRTVS